jgi:exodeoxyribonuclease-5
METPKIVNSIFSFLHFGNPTKDQNKALCAMEKFVSPKDISDFLIISGAAGTGKTSIISALIGYLNHNEHHYKIVAPTGRAARIIGRKSKSTASTIHSLIYKPKNDPNTGVVEFILKSMRNEFPMVFIIDESSMIPSLVNNGNSLFKSQNSLLHDLINYIRNGNPKNKIIFLGDQYQLPPIGENVSLALDKEYIEEEFNLKGDIFWLNEVKRQQDGSYILENATELRVAIDNNASTFPFKGNTNSNIYKSALNFSNNCKTNGLEDCVAIAISHKANKFFNDLVRENIFGKFTKILEVGDLLIVNQNWNRGEDSLFNGDQLELIAIEWDKLEEVSGLSFVPVSVKVLFADEECIINDYLILDTFNSINGTIDFEKEKALRISRYIKNNIFRESDLPSDDRYVGALKLSYGYSITCNKAQGGEWNRVFINKIRIPNLRWQYTAITRGINQIDVF